ncbi:hypothetical protein GOBAR_AA25232 [Gossypium barbadense]|uniref:protein-serine/threonine phosphatase n=1 Tax=Gossypium barbadense TaxID=3634 RepID=A0A2P5WWE9_GOSBA|nr:hypothetical protein GOBAR_AA25232 [Gossypium barbadense]
MTPFSLISLDDTSASTANKDPPIFDGMADAEVERRLKEAISAASTVSSASINLDPRLASSLQFTMPSSSSVPLSAVQSSMASYPNMQFPQAAQVIKPVAPVVSPEPSLQSSPAREEGEVPESELDPDTRRRLLILQHGQDTRDHTPPEPAFPPARPAMQVPVSRAQSRASWFSSDEEMSPRQLNRAVPKEFPLDPERMHMEKHRGPPFFPKVESSSPSDRLLRENQRLPKETAVMPMGDCELHLVAMYSRNSDRPCFWGFNVARGLYDSCLVMLNLRCLGIVFDLDETLVVANTMRSFEDRIEALQRKMNTEVDPQRAAGMMAEIKRYQDDKAVLKQYAENDQVVENGKVIKVQSEIVQPLSDNHQPIIRPLIRLQEKNIILTRINPQIRDTSVLVRLRPAWEDLRSYLTARGRKRFEVYVCTMAERDYALEMWRLLDPESNLINSKELLDRIVCVKSGLRKSLFNVFQDGICHPKMALVIDDRLKVWDEKDQPRVHVVPAFAPYFAPQAEANNTIPVLCVARNVACNVRGGFFREFDEGLLQKIPEISYEDDIKDIPSPPDVGNYLVSEALHRDDRLGLNHTPSSYHSFPGEEMPLGRSSSSHKDLDFESGRTIPNGETPAGVFQDIAMKCGAKVEFRPALVASMDLQFSIEAWFAGEKVGEGTGRTRREAQRQAAEDSIKSLANTYLSRIKPDTGSAQGDLSRSANTNENGFPGNLNLYGNQQSSKEESMPFSNAPEPSRLLDPRLEGSRRSMGSVTALKELCMMEGLGVVFQAQPPASNTLQKDEVYAQVEVDGQVLGKGTGFTWEEAKMQAAEKALGSLRSMLGPFTQKRQGSPRSLQDMPSKRLKPEFPRVLHRMPSSGRYHKNAPPVP